MTSKRSNEIDTWISLGLVLGSIPAGIFWGEIASVHCIAMAIWVCVFPPVHHLAERAEKEEGDGGQDD